MYYLFSNPGQRNWKLTVMGRGAEELRGSRKIEMREGERWEEGGKGE